MKLPPLNNVNTRDGEMSLFGKFIFETIFIELKHSHILKNVRMRVINRHGFFPTTAFAHVIEAVPGVSLAVPGRHK